MQRHRGRRPFARLPRHQRQEQPTDLHLSPCKLCDILSRHGYSECMRVSASEVRRLSAHCPSWSIISKVIGPRIPSFFDINVTITQSSRLLVSPWAENDSGQWHNTAAEICTDEGQASPWLCIKSRTCSIRDAESSAARIRQWRRTCADAHPVCRGVEATIFLPTRVLEILGPQQVVLRESSSLQPAPYACLSHCWGEYDLIRTTKATYDQHIRGILWENLPTTFQHAVDLCRALDMKFLWIDSLCIIQEDINDWRHEGAKMASIYANSSLTIAAVASDDARGGLYRPDGDQVYFRHEIQPESLPAPYTIYGRPQRDHSGYKPLNSRAWYLQERVLSPYTVIFGHHDIAWECKTGHECECTFHHIQKQNGQEIAIKKSIYDDQYKQAYDMALQWQDIVKFYRGMDLTFDSDTLPAIQGIAKVMQVHLGEYYAGIWSTDLFHNLTWYIDSFGRRPNMYVAPTWSWASVKAETKWFEFVKISKQLATVVSISTTPVGNDPTGEVTGGTLVLRGRCATGKLTCVGKVTSKLTGDCIRFDTGVGERSATQVELGEWYPDCYGFLAGEIPLLLLQMAELQHGHGWLTFFMAFKKVSMRDGVYERVGCARTTSNEVRDVFQRHGQEMEITII